MMKTGILGALKRAWGGKETLHPVENRMAKLWIKQRLLAVFPELHGDPIGLERAYRSLSLEPREGTEEGDADTYFQLSAPE
jgi:hypothetical protein